MNKFILFYEKLIINEYSDIVKNFLKQDLIFEIRASLK